MQLLDLGTQGRHVGLVELQPDEEGFERASHYLAHGRSGTIEAQSLRGQLRQFGQARTEDTRRFGRRFERTRHHCRERRKRLPVRRDLGPVEQDERRVSPLSLRLEQHDGRRRAVGFRSDVRTLAGQMEFSQGLAATTSGS